MIQIIEGLRTEIYYSDTGTEYICSNFQVIANTSRNTIWAGMISMKIKNQRSKLFNTITKKWNESEIAENNISRQDELAKAMNKSLYSKKTF